MTRPRLPQLNGWSWKLIGLLSSLVLVLLGVVGGGLGWWGRQVWARTEHSPSQAQVERWENHATVEYPALRERVKAVEMRLTPLERQILRELRDIKGRLPEKGGQ